MKAVVLIKVIVLLVMFHTPAWAYHKWYDEKGIVHYTGDLPPGDAKNEDGSSWWAEEPDEDAGNVALRKKREDTQNRIEQARLKLKNDSAPGPPLAKIPPPIEEDVSQESVEEESEDNTSEGFSIPILSSFKWWDSTRVDTVESGATLLGVWGSSKGDIFAVGTGEGMPVGHVPFSGRGGIFHYNGRKWSEMSSSAHEFLEGIVLYGVWGSSSSDVYAVGSKWTILYYDGIEWSQIESGLSDNRPFIDTADGIGSAPLDGFRSIWGSSANDIYAVGSSPTFGRWGVVMHFDGDSWRQIELPGTTEDHRDLYRCVWGTSAENVFILGGLGRVYHYDGSMWEILDIGESVNLETIGGTSNTDVFAAGNGMIFHYDGEEWNQMLGVEDMHFKGIWGSSPKNVYASGTAVNVGAIYHYTGTEWKRTKIVNKDHLVGIWGHSDGDVFAVGTRSLILRYSGISIFTLAHMTVGLGLGILGWRFIRKLKR